MQPECSGARVTIRTAARIASRGYAWVLEFAAACAKCNRCAGRRVPGCEPSGNVKPVMAPCASSFVRTSRTKSSQSLAGAGGARSVTTSSLGSVIARARSPKPIGGGGPTGKRSTGAAGSPGGGRVDGVVGPDQMTVSPSGVGSSKACDPRMRSPGGIVRASACSAAP